jgi:hypothetical protein
VLPAAAAGSPVSCSLSGQPLLPLLLPPLLPPLLLLQVTVLLLLQQ